MQTNLFYLLLENISPTIPLDKLSASQTALLIESCGLNSEENQLISSNIIMQNNISGVILHSCENFNDVLELEIFGKIAFRAKALFSKILEWKKYGVPILQLEKKVSFLSFYLLFNSIPKLRIIYMVLNSI
jgi:hypothetical protein